MLKFSTILLEKSFSKRVLLLKRDNFSTAGGAKIFARWKDWLWRLVLGLCISLLQYSKVFRLDSIIHDAAGAVRLQTGKQLD